MEWYVYCLLKGDESVKNRFHDFFFETINYA